MTKKEIAGVLLFIFFALTMTVIPMTLALKPDFFLRFFHPQ